MSLRHLQSCTDASSDNRSSLPHQPRQTLCTDDNDDVVHKTETTDDCNAIQQKMTTNSESEPTITKLDGSQPSTAEVLPMPMTTATAFIPISPSISAKPRVTSSVVPLKKRAIRLPHQRLKLKRSSSSGLHKKQRSYTSVSHLERVKFSLFLKILMHYLQMKDEDFVQEARAVVLDCIKSQREGKLQDTPLMSALKGRLFGLVGKNDWEICERYLSRYLAYHNLVTEL